MSSKLSQFFAELKRRKVYRVAAVYATVGVAISLGVPDLFDVFDLPPSAAQLVIILITIGFPIALILAWAYELKPEESRPAGSQLDAALRTSEAATASVVTPAEQRKSIVVLPFDNMSPDPKDAYFSDGLTEEIISTLSHLRSLRVISRSSAMVLKGTQKDVRTIGKELDVQYVLEGSVRKAGNDLRITAQLIDAVSDEHLWAKKYDGVLKDVFGMQETVSRSIVNTLRLSLSPEENLRLAERPVDDVRAYELYLLARRDFWAGTLDGLERARRHLEHALEMIGENVVLLQGLAEVHLHTYEYGVNADEETLQEVEALVRRIAAVRPNVAHSHYLLGRVERFRGSCIRAIDHLEQALVIDPSHSSSQLFLFHSYGFQAGWPDLAAPLRAEVLRQNPLDFLTWAVVGMNDWTRGEPHQALATFRKAGGLVGGSDFADIAIAYTLIWLDRRDDALALLEDLVRRESPDLFTDWARFLIHAAGGELARAGEPLSAETRRYLWNDPEFVWLGASTFALARDNAEALNWLEHAEDRGWINYPLFSEYDPLLESIRKEKRFGTLLERIKPQWETFGATRKVNA